MPSDLHVGLACRALGAGGIVAYPTEAVWGLGCEPLNRHACERLLALKGRPREKGFILIAADADQLRPFVAPIAERVWRPALETWPGPCTWLLPAAPGVPPHLTGGRPTLAARVTAHPVASALCRAYGGPVVSTSANRTGRPPARTALAVRRAFGHGVTRLLAGDTGGMPRPTPIRDLVTGKLVRP